MGLYVVSAISRHLVLKYPVGSLLEAKSRKSNVWFSFYKWYLYNVYDEEDWIDESLIPKVYDEGCWIFCVQDRMVCDATLNRL